MPIVLTFVYNRKVGDAKLIRYLIADDCSLIVI